MAAFAVPDDQSQTMEHLQVPVHRLAAHAKDIGQGCTGGSGAFGQAFPHITSDGMDPRGLVSVYGNVVRFVSVYGKGAIAGAAPIHHVAISCR